MNYIKPYKSYNESWRKTKAFLRIPSILVDIVLSKLLKYIPRLNFLYDSMAAKIDTGTSFNSLSGTRVTEFEKITIDDIVDDKVRKSLKISSFLKDWNVYRITNRLSHDQKVPIYITKDELNPGDLVHGERISIPAGFNTEFYVVVAKHTQEHEDMKRERKSSYEKKLYNSYKAKVEKSKTFFERTSMANFSPLFHTLVKGDYLDLVQICLDRTSDIRELLTTRFDENGDMSTYRSKSALRLNMSDEMRKKLTNALYQDWLKNKDE